MMLRRRRATLRLYASAVRKGVRVPKMLTVDEQFEAIVSDAYHEVRADKMDPYREPAPEPKPVEEKEKQEGEDREK
jgi:hypothetical protein